ncbi:hypothetical protein HUJ04_000243 [Dendroctonus ponderosae]|nr:hypothetical protein HUJ04_000243 [Dendroctonus ponderosae]
MKKTPCRITGDGGLVRVAQLGDGGRAHDRNVVRVLHPAHQRVQVAADKILDNSEVSEPIATPKTPQSIRPKPGKLCASLSATHHLPIPAAANQHILVKPAEGHLVDLAGRLEHQSRLEPVQEAPNQHQIHPVRSSGATCTPLSIRRSTTLEKLSSPAQRSSIYPSRLHSARSIRNCTFPGKIGYSVSTSTSNKGRCCRTSASSTSTSAPSDCLQQGGVLGGGGVAKKGAAHQGCTSLYS